MQKVTRLVLDVERAVCRYECGVAEKIAGACNVPCPESYTPHM